MPAFDKDGLLTIGDAELEYRLIGGDPAAGFTIVMLHEGLGSVSMWRDFPDKVAEATGCVVFVYSRQGYGRSSPVTLPRPLTYMDPEALDVLPALLDRIGFQRGVLLGHSDGASIATIYAGSVEDHRIRGLVLMAPHFFTEDMGIASIARAKEAYEIGDLRGRLQRHHGDNTDNAFWGWNRAWLDPDFRKWDITEKLAYPRVPVLVIQGEDDEYGTTAQVDAVVEECYCPVDVELIAECGHSPHRDQPDRTLNAVAEFVARLLKIEDTVA